MPVKPSSRTTLSIRDQMGSVLSSSWRPKQALLYSNNQIFFVQVGPSQYGHWCKVQRTAACSPFISIAALQLRSAFAHKDASPHLKCNPDGEVLFKNIHAATLSVFGALSCDVPSQPKPIIKAAVPRHSESPPIWYVNPDSTVPTNRPTELAI